MCGDVGAVVMRCVVLAGKFGKSRGVLYDAAQACCCCAPCSGLYGQQSLQNIVGRLLFVFFYRQVILRDPARAHMHGSHACTTCGRMVRRTVHCPVAMRFGSEKKQMKCDFYTTQTKKKENKNKRRPQQQPAQEKAAAASTHTQAIILIHCKRLSERRNPFWSPVTLAIRISDGPHGAKAL